MWGLYLTYISEIVFGDYFMAKKSTVFNVVIPAQMNEQIELVITRVNEKKYQNLNKSQFIRDCVEHVLKHIDDDVNLY